MKEKKLSKISKKSYSPFEKRKIVEEVPSGYYSEEYKSADSIIEKTALRSLST